jgi:hypothetical protein
VIFAASFTVQIVTEGSEPSEFWSAVGGRGTYAERSYWQQAPRDPRLYRCSDAFGRFEVEEISNFDQSDLNNDDVFILDIYTTVFVWIGSGSTTNEKAKASELAERFVSESTDGRDPDVPIIRIHAGMLACLNTLFPMLLCYSVAGEEPAMFTAQFQGWTPFEASTYVDPYEAKVKALRDAQSQRAESAPKLQTSLKSPSKPAPSPVKAATPAAAPAPAPAPAPAAAPVSGTFSLDDLKAGVAGIDVTRKEEYLAPDVFAQLFGTDKASFAAMPKWKRDTKKKELGLF